TRSRSRMICSTVRPPMMDRRWPAKTRPTSSSIRFCSDRKRRAALAIDTASSPTLNTATARTLRRMPWFVTQSSTISASRNAKARIRAFCLTGRTKLPCPVTMRNCVSCAWRFEPEINRASFGAGTCQKNMGDSFGDGLREGRDDDRTCGRAVDDQDAGVLLDLLVRPGRECLRPATYRKEHLTRTIGRDGDGHP